MARYKKKKPAVVRKDTSIKAKRTARVKRETKKVSKEGMYKGIPYESMGEYYFLCYCYELIDAGYMRAVNRSGSYMLLQGLTHEYSTLSKRGSSSIHKSQCFLRPVSYTPDFICVWNKKALGRFIWVMGDNSKCSSPFICHKTEDGDNFSLVECKPDYDFNNKTQYFVLNQKLMWDKHKLFVNLEQTSKFFAATFTPREFLFTMDGKPRKLKYEPRTLNEYLQL